MEYKLIKIIHIIPNLESGGGQRHLLDIIKHSDKAKFVNKIIVLKQAGMLESDFRKTGTELFILNQKIKANIQTLYRTIKIIQKEKPEIVITNFFGGHFYGRIAAKLVGGVKIIGIEDVIHKREIFYKIWIKKYLLNKLVDVIIACSGEVKDWIIKYENAPKEKIEVIYYGIDLKRFIPKNNDVEKLADKKEIIIGTVAILKKQKGLSYLIQAFCKINKIFPQTRLWLIGGARQNLPDNEEKFLKQLTQDLELNGKIIFWGDKKDVPEMLGKLDIFVLPSLFEGFGIVILEAWAACLPVVASRLKCIEEYATHKKNILFSESGNSNDIFKKIGYIIKDDLLRKKIAEEGFLRAQDFNIKKIIEKYEKVFLEILK